ncbi:deoxyribonuclease-2-beta-like [Chaetodon trifascialis]|uniref:deoxyribonuclease-2-beta-like n=1 Tax=Chaetodon trifascialis TaxID=109706 RepID=UPI0039947F40
MWKLVWTFSLFCWSSEARVTCRDENNGEKDWYILYKAPRQGTLTGLEYLYIDSNGVKKMEPLKPSASSGGTAGPSATAYKPINDPEGILANTLRPLFTPVRSMPPNFGFISYSDQPPGCSADEQFGHSKGVVMVDKTGTGVWMLHSTPRFPFRRDQNHFWPDSGNKNAQTFICVTFPYSQFTKIGKHLQYIGAFPFQHDIPPDFHQELQQAVNWFQPAPDNHFQPLISNGGLPVQSIAKNMGQSANDGDLYVSIAKIVDSDLLVQTWGCQPHRKRSFCDKKHKVENIKSINTVLGSWTAKVDHSKWCLAKDPQKHWVCLADVNRATTQYQRRGGALCIDNEAIKNNFWNFVTSIDDCKVISSGQTLGGHTDMDVDTVDPECVSPAGDHTDLSMG